jgi:hypothetical protein
MILWISEQHHHSGLQTHIPWARPKGIRIRRDRIMLHTFETDPVGQADSLQANRVRVGSQSVKHQGVAVLEGKTPRVTLRHLDRPLGLHMKVERAVVWDALHYSPNPVADRRCAQGHHPVQNAVPIRNPDVGAIDRSGKRRLVYIHQVSEGALRC